MSLLLDALQRGTSSSRGKDYTYIYSADDAAEPGVPPAASAAPVSPVKPPAFNRRERRAPRWVLLAGAGSVVLALLAVTAWFWIGSATSSVGLAASPAAPVHAPVPTPASAPVTLPPPVAAAGLVPAASVQSAVQPPAANPPVTLPPMAAPVLVVKPQPSPSVRSLAADRQTRSAAERALGLNTPELEYMPLPVPVKAVPSEGKAGATVASRQVPKNQDAPNKPAPPVPEVAAKSELTSSLSNAWALLERGQWAEAEAGYRGIIGRSKTPEPDAVLGLAVSLHRQKRWAEAWEAYEASLRVWPANPVASAAMLDILAHTQAPTAEVRLRQWIVDRPQDAAVFSTYGLLQGRKANWPEAVTMLRRARELDPTNGVFAYNLAVALDQSRRYAEAAEQYQAALGLGGLGAVATVVKVRLGELAQLVQP